MMNTSLSQFWKDTLLTLGSTIQQSIYSLEQSSMQIVLVITEENKLIGTLTDGDIRRAFLKGKRLEDTIDDIVNLNPLVVPPEIGSDFALKLMKINKINQLPIVDNNGIVIGLHIWNFTSPQMSIENMMLIMAGGKGTRMRPHTENCPKPMLHIAGRPMLEHILERAITNGFKNFIISINYLGHIIEDYFGNGNAYGVNINYLREDAPLGTAGCLSLLSDIPRLPFIVTNGDVLTDIQYHELLNFHSRHEASATMAVRQHEIQNQFGVVRTNGVEIEAFEEKPIYKSHVNAGIYVLGSDALKLLEPGLYCDMPALFERLKNNGHRTIVYPMHEPWLDVGRPEDLITAQLV